jgi:CheY-like chemotaxis protein
LNTAGQADKTLAKNETFTSSKENAVKGRILLAEDNPVNQQVACEMLEVQDCQVRVANNGKEAVAALSDGQFDIVLMDCHMPEMDGFEATSIIRKLEKENGVHQGVPIIALTANAIEGNRKHCLELGMNDFLSKPFTRHQLIETLRCWLSQTNSVDPITEALHSDDDTSAAVTLNRPSEHSLLNEAALNNIRSLQRPGRPDVLQKVINQYIEYTPELLDQLRNAITENDSKSLYMAAHSLKSSNANLGALELAALCADLELKGREQSLAGANEILTKIELQHGPVVNELKTFLDLKSA